MTHNKTSLHSEESGNAIWNGHYHNPLLVAESAYKASHTLLESIIKHPNEYSLAHFGIVDVDPYDDLPMAKKDFFAKAMTYVSTLFSVINSPKGLLPWKSGGFIFALREVIGEIMVHMPFAKSGQEPINSSHKEVLMG